MKRSSRMTYLLPHLVEQAAARDPDHVAMRFRDDTMTYGALFERAACLANALVSDGVQPGDRVGILLNKSLESAVALYGIMMAGAVYVPLDPLAPSSRIEFVTRDCGVRRLVTSDRKVDLVESLVSAGVDLDAVFGPESAGDAGCRSVPWRAVDEYAASPPSIRTMEQDLCYILYTSGSTGTPKGIMHTHRSALAWAELTASVYELNPEDVISNYAPLHFDLSTLDYFGGARAGATTVIIPEEYTKFPASLAGLIEKEQLTLFYTVPMALIQLAQPGILDGRDLGKLRLVLFGGEPMPIKHLRDLMDRLPHTGFVNVYGPTETNGCTHYPVDRPLSDSVEALPIGRAYPNVDVLVVDEESAPVPVGEPGELLVRAPTMMRGYWGRDDLNERAFFERTPYGGLAEVFHRTGDLVRELPDGTLGFLGRRDRQIKSRGNRVELDEVEAVLVGHDDVHEAAVYAVRGSDGMLEIRAEAILRDGREIEAAELIRSLRARLPAYAVPVALHLRSAFPRTSTGKIDRRAMLAEAEAQLAATTGD